MVAWAAVIPALKAAAPWIAKAGGAALSLLGSKNLFGGGSSSEDGNGSGITYNAQIPDIRVNNNNNNNTLYSQIAGQQPMFGNSLYNRLIR